MKKSQIKTIMAEIFEVDLNEIDDNISQKNTSEWDSLRHLNLMVEIEEKFDVSFTPEQIGSLTSLKLIINELDKND